MHRAGVTLALALPLGGCVDGGSAVSIVQNQIPTSAMGVCVVPGGKSDLRLAEGILDVGLDRPYPYKMFPLLQSVLPALATMGGAEPNRFEVTSFHVKIDPPSGISVPWTSDCAPSFDFPTQGQVLPGASVAFLVEGIRPCHADQFRQLFANGQLPSALSQEVVFRLTLEARGRHGGTQISSDPFYFPVRVCYGCLQTGYTDPEFADFSFPKIPACDRLASNPFPGNPCNPAQDMGPVLCCARDPQGQQLECPGIPRMAPTTTKP
jgi:hypothetical protein